MNGKVQQLREVEGPCLFTRSISTWAMGGHCEGLRKVLANQLTRAHQRGTNHHYGALTPTLHNFSDTGPISDEAFLG